MLTSYLAQTQALLQNPSAPTTLYTTANLTNFINIARGQLAGEAEVCRYLGTISLTVDQRNYNFSSISTGTASVTGLSGVLTVRAMRYAVGSGYQWIRPRPWPWFDLFKMNNPVPESGAPEVWSQYSRGASGGGSITGVGSGSLISGSFYVDPIPDLAYVITADCVCYPQALSSDSDVEAIPFLFTDAIPYYASYLALLTSQTGQRNADAIRYFEIYKMFVERAVKATNPSVNNYLYVGANDPAKINKLGVQKTAGG